MSRPRRQVYTMEMYLRKIKSKDISNDAEVQRHFVWKKEQINELLYTIFTDDYIPPVILGEVNGCQLYIVDGGQRSAACAMFRYGNYKITKSIENSIITYKEKIINEDGSVCWEDKECNIIGKTYDSLPIELKKRFDEYQLETVIHENCTMSKISELIKRYNLHTSMNQNQRSLTYLINHAKTVREILDSAFFLDASSFTEAEKNNGTVERVVMESVMAMNYIDNWNQDTKRIAKFLNNNATIDDFCEVEEYFNRLSEVGTEITKEIFNSKNTFLWVALFKRFTELHLDDSEFIRFLEEFNNSDKMQNMEYNGETYYSLCYNEKGKTRSTKDSYIVKPKLELLTYIMYDYFDIGKSKVA